MINTGHLKELVIQLSPYQWMVRKMADAHTKVERGVFGGKSSDPEGYAPAKKNILDDKGIMIKLNPEQKILYTDITKDQLIYTQDGATYRVGERVVSNRKDKSKSHPLKIGLEGTVVGPDSRNRAHRISVRFVNGSYVSIPVTQIKKLDGGASVCG